MTRSSYDIEPPVRRIREQFDPALYTVARADQPKANALALLNVEQVADTLGISTRTVWRLVSGGRLPQPVAIGRCKRWKRRDVEKFVDGLES